MKKKIAILGSTGSIGQNTFDILKKNKKNFEITLLSTNRKFDKVIKQAKELKVKNVIITDLNSFKKAKRKFRSSKIKIYKDFKNLNQIFRKKNDLIMSSITGLMGLEPTLRSIKYTKKILIANKEALICGWSLINKELKKYKTDFVPVDSEHFSIWVLLQNYLPSNIEKIYITASGGPFLNLPKKNFSKISVKKALKHPNWSMGKKISIDSATLMNKVFEVIEAKNIFDLPYNKISILTHPNSYIHAIVKFKNGLIKILAHDPDMKIPINNLIYSLKNEYFKSKQINFKILNNLNFRSVNINHFPLVKLLKKLPNQTSLYETIIISINDYFVQRFLDNKISYKQLISFIYKFSKLKDFRKYKKIKPKNIEDIYRLRDYVSLKMNTLGI